MSEGLSIRPQTLRLAPSYRRLRDAILRPQLRLTESRYFWERWKPRLGADAAVLIMEVRDRCNRALAAPPAPMGAVDSQTDRGMSGVLNIAGEPEVPAEGCTVSATDLATACGFSRVTLWRILQREDVRRFVTVEHNYVYDRRLGKKRRTFSTYHVQMEDPLLEEDEARLQQLLAGQAPEPEAYPRPRLQTETEVVYHRPPPLHSETANSGSSPKPQNVEETKLNQRLGTNEAPRPAGRAAIEVDIWRRYPDLAHHVEEAERLLDDSHSRGFYLKALKQLHPGYMDVWQRALGLAREQQNIRRSRGALFTRLLRTFAAEAGVTL